MASVIAMLVPAAGALQILGAVPMGVVAQRHRPRAWLAATVAATAVGFLMGGSAPAAAVVGCAVLGGMVGDVKRRGRGVPTIMLYAAVVAPLSAGLVDGLLLVFSRSRELTLVTLRNSVHGAAELMGRVPALAPAAADVDKFAGTVVDYWWISIAAAVAGAVLLGTWFSWAVVGAVLERLSRVSVARPLEGPPDAAAPGPVPVTLVGVRYRYPGQHRDALAGIDLSLPPASFVAVVGPNGSGKSTLAQLLAGVPPTAGTVSRPGGVGLGRTGGTAVVAQRPETQVLGVLVADDVVWGLPPDAEVDVAGLLDAVGLAGMGGRETTTLSGGELQRLAVAAALARRPALLISDESTSMVDAAGRETLVDLLAELPGRYGMTVVHVTHHEREAARADRVVHLAEGRIVDAPAVPGARARPDALPASSGAPLLQVSGVSHYYAAGTPWEQPALDDVALTVRSGEGLLVVGGNGSGKSTLAWILAGLLRPSQGRCLLDGRPVDERVGAVALAFQHARLQVQRSTVGEDVAAAAGLSWGREIAAALRTVELDPALAARNVDELSGGQLRRVALAGLLARRPRVLVLDEPLAGLDAAARLSLVALLARLRRDEGLTLIVISHDVEDFAELCSRTVELRGGRIVAGEAHDSRGAALVTGDAP